MEQKIDNRLNGGNVEGDYIGGNQTKKYYISMYQDSEREFVVTHNANIKPVAYFTGREMELKDLRQRIEEGRKSVLVSGMGGIGKTHICRKLFEEYLNKHANSEDIPFCHIGYIEYNGDMGNSLQNCLKYKEQDNPGQNQEAAWKELEYLTADGKLLLFVDDVNVTMKEDEGLKRLKSIPGAVVLTSRRTSFSKEFEPYRIGFLNVGQCKNIYERIRYEDSGRRLPENEIPDLEYIIEKLAAKHTITIEFLAHLAWTKHWTVKKLRYELEEKGFQLEYKDEEDELVNIQKSYETLYDLSKLTKAEQNILEAFSVFPYIPLAAETCNQWLLSDAGASEDDDILTGLYRKGWLQFNLEHENYSLHPVFAKFIYEKCKPVVEAHHGLIEACQKCLEIPESGSAMECQKYIPFAENIVEKMNINKKEKAEFTYIFAKALEYIVRYEKAEKYYLESIRIYIDVLGENNINIARVYDGLAHIYSKQINYYKAEELYKRSLEIRKSILGENHTDTASSYNNLAYLYRIKGDYKEAKKFYNKSISIWECVCGKNHLDTADGYNNLAYLYRVMGDYGKAKELYEKSLNIWEKLCGENHPDTADGYNNLGYVYRIEGNIKKAKELYEKSLKIRESLLGEEHLYTADSYNNLAYLYKMEGNYKEAKKLYKKSLQIWKKVFGERHPDTAYGYNNLAIVYEKLEHNNSALNYYFKAYNIFVHELKTKHDDTQNVYNKMELLYNGLKMKGDFNHWLEEKMKETEYQ